MSETKSIENKKKEDVIVRSITDRGRLVLSSDFETGNAINFQKFDENIYGFMPKKDPGSGYSGQSYYFKFSAKNLTRDEINFTISAVADYDNTWKGWTQSLESKLWSYMGTSFTHYDMNLVRTNPKSITINVKLMPKQEVKISNMLTIPYSDMVAELEIVQLDYPNFVKMQKIGESNENNGIYSLIIDPNNSNWNNQNKTKILISGSPQSNEFGDFAAIQLLKMFLSKQGEYWDEFHEHFRLEFIFFQNPDGIINGTNMVNSKAENVFFSFNKSLDSLPKETSIVWNYIKENPPDFYLEFHSFFQDLKKIRPYTYPQELFSSKIRKKLQKKIKKILVSLCNGAKEEININQPYFSDTLCYRLQEEFQTISFQFKLHSCMEFEDTKDLIWQIFKKSLKPLEKLKEN
jgi:hypothetical protein